jgi:hypothetical protein
VPCHGLKAWPIAWSDTAWSARRHGATRRRAVCRAGTTRWPPIRGTPSKPWRPGPPRRRASQGTHAEATRAPEALNPAPSCVSTPCAPRRALPAPPACRCPVRPHPRVSGSPHPVSSPFAAKARSRTTPPAYKWSPSSSSRMQAAPPPLLAPPLASFPLCSILRPHDHPNTSPGPLRSSRCHLLPSIASPRRAPPQRQPLPSAAELAPTCLTAAVQACLAPLRAPPWLPKHGIDPLCCGLAGIAARHGRAARALLPELARALTGPTTASSHP